MALNWSDSQTFQYLISKNFKGVFLIQYKISSIGSICPSV